METIQFNKSLCGVDLLLNVSTYQDLMQGEYPKGVHNTDFFEILFLEAGEGYVELDQSRVPLTPGQVIFMSQKQVRRWQTKPHGLEATFLIFQEDFLNEFFSDYLFTFRLLYFYQNQHPLYLIPDDADLKRYREILAEIKTELQNPKADSAHIIRSLLYYLLMQLNRRYAATYQIEMGVEQNNYAFQFRRLLEKHIQTRQRIQDYAQLLGISRITLNQATKAQFNATASDLIKQRLIQEVKNLLIYSSQTIAEIAHELSFSEPNHLTRLFKSREGLTPSQYRINYHNGR